MVASGHILMVLGLTLRTSTIKHRWPPDALHLGAFFCSIVPGSLKPTLGLLPPIRCPSVGKISRAVCLSIQALSDSTAPCNKFFLLTTVLCEGTNTSVSQVA